MNIIIGVNMKKMVLIGGGDIGRGNTAYETKEIDEEIVKMTKLIQGIITPISK